MTNNINFPRNFTIGDLKELIEDLPSDGLVEFFYVAECGCCINREFLGKSVSKKLFEFRKEVDVPKGVSTLKVPVLYVGKMFAEDLL